MFVRSSIELSKLLKNQRKKLNLTQKEVGERVGIKQKTISALENNAENMKLNTLFRVLSALETEMNLIPHSNQIDHPSEWQEEW